MKSYQAGWHSGKGEGFAVQLSPWKIPILNKSVDEVS
jgi:hypothetical protein